jgi:hypothetical protein
MGVDMGVDMAMDTVVDLEFRLYFPFLVSEADLAVSSVS